MLVVTGCDDPGDDVIWDISPFQLSLQVVDAEGHSRLDPASGQGFLDKITATYEGHTYLLDYTWFQPKAESSIGKVRHKMCLARFRGLYLMPYGTGGDGCRYTLNFGEFQGEKDLINKDLVIDWGDGSRDTFTLYHTCKWKNNEPHIVNRICRNGKEMKAPEDFIIVK